MARMHPVDARMLWAAPAGRSDQFLLYAFDHTAQPVDAVCEELMTRARIVESLGAVAREVPGHLDYPSWVSAGVLSEQVRVHNATTWPQLLTALASTMSNQVDARIRPWRLHLFDEVSRPHDDSTVRVVVLQISHALADGRGASDLARQLFSASPPPGRRFSRPASSALRAAAGILRLPGQVGALVVDGAIAYRRAREILDDGPSAVTPAAINRTPGSQRVLGTLAVDRAEIDGRVTPRVLAAIGDALAAGGLVDGDPVIELTLARAASTVRDPANNFFMAGIATRTDLGGAARIAAIVDQIDAARTRDAGAARAAARRAEAATPAVLMYWATTGFAGGESPSSVTGHTVVSSVNRGAADLTLAGGAVRLTAGFPALSSVHSLNHGVHGIGDTVTVSVIADPNVVDVDAHLAALGKALLAPTVRWCSASADHASGAWATVRRGRPAVPRTH